jgi:acetoacetyl-CoA synthetase
MTRPHPAPFMSPDAHSAAASRIADFGRWAARHRGVEAAFDHTDYAALHRWSVTDLEGFWGAVWEYFDIDADTPYEKVLAQETMPGADWFTGATLNYAHHALRNLSSDQPAIIALDEAGSGYEVSAERLRAQVASVAATLSDLGVSRGDRVVGYLPNTPHAIIAFLAAASLGAVWSVCGQDYAPKAAADRFAQLEPTVLIAADGYLFNGSTHDRREAALDLARALPTLKAAVLVNHVGLTWPPDGCASPTIPWDEAVARTEKLTCTPVPFDHPLWVVFSSGTTGLPKGIVHGHGGVLLEHLKTLALHCDLGSGDRLLWYTTTHWMMWNLVASTLLTGATTCTYDGSPAPFARPDILWELAARYRVTVFGTSPQYLLGMAKFGISPSAHDLSSIRAVGCTGSALPASAYPWVRDQVGGHVQLASTSGGTDIVSGFAGSTPTTSVWAGELSAPNLGVALAAYDPEGRPVTGQVGELVVSRPMPSMPLYFWNDPDGSRYREAYFSSYPGVWRHGDWITHTSHGSVIVHGRSDSTLNRHGVRLGSADIHDVVERLPEINEALVIGAEETDGGYWMPLFVVPTPGVTLDDAVRDRIRDAIRTGASPRHVPDEILEVPAIPHTRTGKKLEVPVKRLLQGAPAEQVVNPAAVDAPELIEYYARLGADRRSRKGTEAAGCSQVGKDT